MKISEIDKDLEEIIYYLDNNGFRPYASCDGVKAHHKNKRELTTAYVAFLKSLKITDLMARFLKDKDNFHLSVRFDDSPYVLYGNIISGISYAVYFHNKKGEKTKYFEDIIKDVVEKEQPQTGNEKIKLDMLEKVLEEVSTSDLNFEVVLNGEYQPYMHKKGKINELSIKNKGRRKASKGRNMEALSSILSKKYCLAKRKIFKERTYPETEYIVYDKYECSIYFTDERFPQILDSIKYSAQIADTLPTFEWKNNYYDDAELLCDYDDKSEWENIEYELFEKEEKISLEQLEEELTRLEKESERLSKEEEQIQEVSKGNEI